MNPISRTIVVWLLVALLFTGVLLYAHAYKVEAIENKAKANKLSGELRDAEEKLSGLDKVLSAYRAQSQRNAELTAEQQGVVDELHSEASVRSQRIRQLESENEQIKRWADTLLPDGIARMRVRPTITGAKAYYQWLSNGNSVRAAGGEPIVKPRSELKH